MSSSSAASARSSYLQYLPPLLRATEADPDQLLARFLCIFEAILTGRPDAPPLTSVRDGISRTYAPFERLIDQLPDLFDSSITPTAALPFLAARLGIDLFEEWDEFRKRRLIEGAFGIYQQRWLKRGLYTFIQLYGASEAKPRVVIDDGEALLAARWQSTATEATIDLHPLAFARPRTAPRIDPATNRPANEPQGEALLHPVALAIGTNNGKREYVVADSGPNDLLDSELKPFRLPSLWRLSESGQFMDWTNSSPSRPTALNEGEPGTKLQEPKAIVAEKNGSYLVLDLVDRSQFGQAVIYRYQPGQVRAADPVVKATDLKADNPVDMILDDAGRLLVLDWGQMDLVTKVQMTRLIRVDLSVAGHPVATSFSLAKTDANKPGVVTPTALVLEPGGTVLIADARRQDTPKGQSLPYPADLQKQLAGDLVRVTLDPFKTESLLGSLGPAKNPLIYPTSLLAGPSGSVLVCDRGFKENSPTDINGKKDEGLVRVLAEPAGLYRIDFSPELKITPVRLPLPLVQPRRLARDGERLLVLENGLYQEKSDKEKVEWRAEPHHFGLTVFLSATRPTDMATRRSIFQTLAGVLDSERPAHAVWNFQFASAPVVVVAPPADTPGLAEE